MKPVEKKRKSNYMPRPIKGQNYRNVVDTRKGMKQKTGRRGMH